MQGDLNIYAPDSVASDEWDLAGLYDSLNQTFPLVNYATADDLKGKSREELSDFVTELAQRSYADRAAHFAEILGPEDGPAEMRTLERNVTLQSLDRHWMEHLSNMDYLREGIGWRGYSGIDPKVLYKKEAYDMFQQMLASVQDEVVRIMSFISISLEPQTPQSGSRPMTMQGADEDGMGGPGAPARADRRRAAKGRHR